MSDQNPDGTPDTDLDRRIADVLSVIDNLDPYSEEYAKANDQLVKLHKLKMAESSHELEVRSSAAKFNLEREKTDIQHMLDLRPKPVDKNTLILAGANLLGIVAIVGHERAHVVTSKAIGFLKTLR